MRSLTTKISTNNSCERERDKKKNNNYNKYNISHQFHSKCVLQTILNVNI